MYSQLNAFFERPEPYSAYTTPSLWTDPHRAGEMLKHHLSDQSDAASRRPATIAGIVDWLDRQIGLAGKTITDLGCGPGLYDNIIAQRGGRVTGLDFSENSLNYARAQARKSGLDIDYRQVDYLKDDLPDDQDVVMLIYCDLCPLSPDQRQLLIEKVRKSLKPGGVFVFDVLSAARFARLSPTEGFARRHMDGFWAKGDYFGFEARFLYPDLMLALERYLIVTPDAEYQIYNWLQHFDEASIARELTSAGFGPLSVRDVFTGADLDPKADAFMVMAQG